MKNKNKLEIIGFVLILIGTIFVIINFTKFQFSSGNEGVFVTSIGLIILGIGSSKKRKEQKEKEKDLHRKSER